MSRTAASLIIGNELLSGKTQETNLVELARLLRSLGVRLRRVVVVADEVPTIAAEVLQLSSTHDFLFTSGGVGPTHDDVTMEAIAFAFGTELVHDPVLLEMLRRHYGENLNEGQMRLAAVPEGARLLTTSTVRWPVTVMRNVWILPGIPEVFRMKLPIIREHLGIAMPFITRAVFTNMEEPFLKELLDQVVGRHPEVEIGSYPAWSDPDYRTKITFDGKENAAIEEALQDFLTLLPEGEPQWEE